MNYLLLQFQVAIHSMSLVRNYITDCSCFEFSNCIELDPSLDEVATLLHIRANKEDQSSDNPLLNAKSEASMFDQISTSALAKVQNLHAILACGTVAKQAVARVLSMSANLEPLLTLLQLSCISFPLLYLYRCHLLFYLI